MEAKLSKFSETLEKISMTLETRLAEMDKKMKQMADGMDDLENRSRRDNIRVLNLEESTEGNRPALQSQSIIQETLKTNYSWNIILSIKTEHKTGNTKWINPSAHY